MITSFDDEIKEMQKEKYRLESDLKNADLKLILLFEELILLKSMQREDERLTSELKKCTESKGYIIKEIQEITKRLLTKKTEIEDIKEEETKLLNQFHELVDTNHEHYDQILNFYEKITRKRRKPEKIKAEDGDGDEDDDEDGDEEEQDDEEVFLSSKIIHSTTNTSVVANQHMEPLDEHEEKHNFTAFSVETRHLSLEDDKNPIKIKKSPVNHTFSEIPKSTTTSTRLSRSNSNRSGTTPRSWIRNVSHSSKRFLTKIDSSLMGKEKDEKGNIFAFAQDNEMEQSVTGLDNEKSLEKAKRIKKERKMMVLSIMIVTVMTFVIWYVSITGMFFRDEFIKVKISIPE